MAAKFTIDLDYRIIEATDPPVDGFVTTNVLTDLYGPLKDDWHSTASLQRLKFPLREQIGQDTGKGQIGPYVFLFNQDGWRLLPYDDDHDWVFVGGNLRGQAAVEGIPNIRLINKRPGRTITPTFELSTQALTRDIPTSGLTHNESTMMNEFYHTMCRRMITNPITGMCEVYNEHGVKVMEGAIWEDAAGTQPYRGKGIERRDPLMPVTP